MNYKLQQKGENTNKKPLLQNKWYFSDKTIFGQNNYLRITQSGKKSVMMKKHQN